MQDLLLVVPDKNTHFALRGALARPEALGTRAIAHRFDVHPHRDSGVRTTGAALANLRRPQFRHALLIFDREGCGDEAKTLAELEAAVEATLRPAWGDDARAIVIHPEVDVWLWGADNTLAEVLRWPAAQGIRTWLTERGWRFDANGKPERSKEAFEKLREVHGIPRSSSLYEAIASRLSLRRCADASFQRLRETLCGWFPPA
jgi:hypothetical protein